MKDTNYYEELGAIVVAEKNILEQLKLIRERKKYLITKLQEHENKSLYKEDGQDIDGK